MSSKLSLLLAGTVAGAAIAGAVAFGICSKKCNPVAVLDLARVRVEAKAFEKVEAETEKYISALKARFADQEKDLQGKSAALQQKINASGGKTAAYEKEIKELNKQLADFQRTVRIQYGLILKAKETALSQVTPVAQATLKELSQKNGLSIILPRPYVTYVKPRADVTDEFIKLLDGKDVKVSFPNPEQFTATQQNANVTKETAGNK